MEIKAFFDKEGWLIDVSPRQSESLYEDRGRAYNADIFIIDRVEYSMNSPEDVEKLPIIQEPATGNILIYNYILKMKCGRVENPEVVRVLVPKTLEQMQKSSFIWRTKDYLQVIRNFYRVGLFAEGDAFEKEYRNSHPFLFKDLAIEEHEKEHTSTKAYWVRKYKKKHPDENLDGNK